MKRFLKILLLAVLSLTFAFSFVACTEGDGGDGDTGLLYKMFEGDDYYTVYGYVDDGTSLDTLDIGEYNDDDIRIGRIKANAFKDNDTLKNLIIPSTVEVIDAGAFANMKKLESITLPFVGATAVADTSFNSIDESEDKSVGVERTFGYVFGTESYTGGLSITQNYDETNTNVSYIPQTLKTVIINNDTQTAYNIPMYAFNGVNLINQVVLQGNIGIIGEAAFKNALGLTTINIPLSVSKIEKQAFMGTANLKEGFTFDQQEGVSSNLAVIGESAFNGSAIKSIALPDSVIEIGASCFANSKLENATIGSVVVIPTGAFANCAYLTEITIPESTNIIKAHAFVNCDALSIVNFTGTWSPVNPTATNLVSDYLNSQFTK